jgi:hypothetical protein
MSDATGDAKSDSSSDASCLTWALGGIGVPSGTVATASATYSTDVPSNAIDGDLTTEWNADGHTGSLTLQFPTPQTITGIRMATTSSPPTEESYIITASGSSTTIGSATEMVNGSATDTIEPAISVTRRPVARRGRRATSYAGGHGVSVHLLRAGSTP